MASARIVLDAINVVEPELMLIADKKNRILDTRSRGNSKPILS